MYHKEKCLYLFVILKNKNQYYSTTVNNCIGKLSKLSCNLGSHSELDSTRTSVHDLVLLPQVG